MNNFHPALGCLGFRAFVGYGIGSKPSSVLIIRVEGLPRLYFLLFPIKAAVFHLSLGVEDCFSLVVLLMQRRRPTQHISLIQKIFSSLHSSMHN